MQKIVILFVLLTSYVGYSVWVYTSGTSSNTGMTADAIRGKVLWQQKNCQNCHQLFGLGGYMGPDLTTVISDSRRGRLYAKGMITAGGSRMPNFHFDKKEVNELIAWLEYVDRTSEKNTR